MTIKSYGWMKPKNLSQEEFESYFAGDGLRSYTAGDDLKEGEPVFIGKDNKAYKFSYGPAWETTKTEAKINPVLDAQAGPDGVYRVEGEIDPALVEYELIKQMGEAMQDEINKLIRGMWGIP